MKKRSSATTPATPEEELPSQHAREDGRHVVAADSPEEDQMCQIRSSSWRKEEQRTISVLVLDMDFDGRRMSSRLPGDPAAVAPRDNHHRVIGPCHDTTTTVPRELRPGDPTIPSEEWQRVSAEVDKRRMSVEWWEWWLV